MISSADDFAALPPTQLAALVAIAEDGSFAAAAIRLGCTQSAVSQRIAALERAVGARLLHRPGGRRAVSLTPAGAVLVRCGEDVRARLAAALREVEAIREGRAGSVRVGAYSSAGARILPPVLAALRATAAGLHVELVDSDSDEELMRLIDRGELDLSFTVLPAPKGPFASVELLVDPYVLLVPRGHPLAARGTAPPLRELGGLPLIALRHGEAEGEAEGYLRRREIEPHVVFRTDNHSAIEALVAVEVGCAILPRLALGTPREDVVRLPLGARLPPRRVGLLWHRQRLLTPVAQRFIEITAEICRSPGAFASDGR